MISLKATEPQQEKEPSALEYLMEELRKKTENLPAMANVAHLPEYRAFEMFRYSYPQNATLSMAKELLENMRTGA